MEAEGQDCLVLQGDVTKRAFCKRAVAQTVKKLGGLDILVNNAAFQLHVSRFEDLTEAHLDRTMRPTCAAISAWRKPALPYLKRGAAIVNTGSVTGLHGNKALLMTGRPRAVFTPSHARWRRTCCRAEFG